MNQDLTRAEFRVVVDIRLVHKCFSKWNEEVYSKIPQNNKISFYVWNVTYQDNWDNFISPNKIKPNKLLVIKPPL